MPSKDTIIDDIKDYSPQQIANYVCEGIVTIPEILRENPREFASGKRKEVEAIIWERVKDGTDMELLKTYIDNYPAGNYVGQARDMLLRGGMPQPEIREQPVIPPVNYPPFEPSRPRPPQMPPPPPAPTPDPYESLDTSDLEAVKRFILEYGNHEKTPELRELVRNLNRREPKGPEALKEKLNKAMSQQPDTLFMIVKREFDNGRITSSELLDLFREDHNFLPLEVVRMMVEENMISTFELESIGIRKEFIEVLEGNYVGLIDTPVEVDGIDNPNVILQRGQEFYFWGMPSSGKTCALGAILSAAGTGRVARSLEKTDCHGYDYMRQLSELFSPGKISVLPTGSRTDKVIDMSFKLYDNRKRSHAITLIDMAGEVLYATYLMNQKNPELTDDQEIGYKTMRRLLTDSSSQTSKIHFFVIEYGAHDRKEKGIRQVDMLTGALEHIKKLGILKKTDAVFILMTKADKALKEGPNVGATLENYLKKYYQSFYNLLSDSTQNISHGEIMLIPFTVGDVCFRDLCLFNDNQANKLVQLLLDSTVGRRGGRLGDFINIISG